MEEPQIPAQEETRAKLFLWCSRHCCFCGRACTTNMEIHHVDGNHSNNDEDNLIPVCFDCHGELGSYNAAHPRGSKYRELEIKSRREQVYELHTRKYLRPVDIKISSRMHHVPEVEGKPKKREWGDFSCTVITLSSDIPVKLLLRLEPYQNSTRLETTLGDLYSGGALWNLNPSQTVFGHFALPIKRETTPFCFRVEIFWSIVDVLDRKHQMLPFSYVWNTPEEDWWYDPRVIYPQP